MVPSLDGMEVTVTATVGDYFLDEVIEGFSIARVYNSSIKLAFLGDTPQVFKPGMPITVYVSKNYFTELEKFTYLCYRLLHLTMTDQPYQK